MNHFCFAHSDKRGPLALTGHKAAKVEWVLRAPFVWQRPHLSDTNAALAVVAASATVTNLFGLDNHQFTAVTRPSSQAAWATLWIHSQRTCTRTLVTSGFKFWQSAINFDDFAPLWVEGSQGPWPASGLNDFWSDFLGPRSNHLLVLEVKRPGRVPSWWLLLEPRHCTHGWHGHCFCFVCCEREKKTGEGGTFNRIW